MSKLLAGIFTFSVMLIPAYLLSAFITQALSIGAWPIWLRFIDAIWMFFVYMMVLGLSTRK